MNVLHVCAEFFPLVKTGGLADVTGALPFALKAQGIDVRILLPGYPTLLDAVGEAPVVAKRDTFAGTVFLRYGVYNGLGIYMIDAPHLYHRAHLYHDGYLNAYGDNYLRFGLLGWFAAELASGLDYFWRPELVHAHDWHAGLSAAYLAARGYPAKVVFTVHNLAYTGDFLPHHLSELQLPPHFFHVYGLEFYGQISFLKAGFYYADHITTVSPTYAREICLPAYGNGFEGFLSEKKASGQLTGILNGIDQKIWNPALDPLPAQRYDIDSLAEKAVNKQALQKETGVEIDARTPLFVMISRLCVQKGLDMVLQVLPEIIAQGGQFILLGCGDDQLEEAFKQAERQYPGRVAISIGYDESLSHRMISGADVILVPSRFEPCGLTQMYGLAYGTLPLVRYTGGLTDTVFDCSLENLLDHSANGFVFYESETKAFSAAIRRVFALWQQPEYWRKVQHQAMKADHGWSTAAQRYHALYQGVLDS